MKMRAATMMSSEGHEQEETKEKKDDITRLKKGEGIYFIDNSE